MSHILNVLELLESARGIAGVMQQRRAQGITTLPGIIASPPKGKGLQSLQAKAGHKTPPNRTPSNKPSWTRSALKSLGKKALSYHNPIGLGVTAGLDAIAPGLGIISRAVQQTFGDQIIEDTSQSGVSGAMLFGYHKGFWTVNSGPNQPTVSIPNHQVYGQDGVTKIVGKPGMRGRIVKTKNGPAFKSDDSGGPVSNPVGGTPLTVGVNYASRT